MITLLPITLNAAGRVRPAYGHGLRMRGNAPSPQGDNATLNREFVKGIFLNRLNGQADPLENLRGESREAKQFTDHVLQNLSRVTGWAYRYDRDEVSGTLDGKRFFYESVLF